MRERAIRTVRIGSCSFHSWVAGCKREASGAIQAAISRLSGATGKILSSRELACFGSLEPALAHALRLVPRQLTGTQVRFLKHESLDRRWYE